MDTPTFDGRLIPMNPNVADLSPSATVAINDRCNALIAQGGDVYKLGLGQSPFPVAASVVSALQHHAHEKDYLPASGLPALREAVASYHRRVDGIDASADGVLIGPGSKELMYGLQLVVEAELVLPSPSWVSYAPQAQIAGRTCVYLRTHFSDEWRLTPETLDAHCRQGGAKTRLLILNTPSNPTGMAYSEAQLAALADVARRHGVLVMSDEIYGELHHEGRHCSFARVYPEGTIVSAGLSKWCGAGGWRLGTFHFPPNLYAIRDAMFVLATETFTSTCAPIQHAAIQAYERGPDIEAYLRSSRRIVQGLGRWSATQLRAAGAAVHDPEGGFYLFPDLSARRDALREAYGVQDSVRLCERLLTDTGVAILPGACFGHEAEELTVRLAYVNFDGQRALDAAPDGTAIDEAWLRTHCGETVTAIERLAGWVSMS